MIKMNRKIVVALLVIIVLIVVGFMVKEHLNANNSNQIETVQNNVTPTPIRHDNSGAGSNPDEGNSIQDHFGHALQHLGL